MPVPMKSADELLAKGIILEDTREGVKWKERNNGFYMKYIREALELPDMGCRQVYSPLVLAYLGDCVLTRSWSSSSMVVSEGNMQVQKLHEEVCSSYVQACCPGRDDA